MVPTSPASFVQIGALWIFFIPRVPPLHCFSFLIPQTPTRCKNTSKSLPSLFLWWSPPVLQVLSRLEHFDFFLFQGYPLCIIFRFWSLTPQQGASKLQNHFPAYFFDGPHQSCKFRPDWSTLNFFSSKGPPFGYFPDFDKMQKKLHFLFFEIRTPFFDSILRTAPGTILKHCHQVWPPVLRRNQHFDARDFVCWPAAARLLESKKWVFQNCFPFKILHEFFISCIPRHHWYFSI